MPALLSNLHGDSDRARTDALLAARPSREADYDAESRVLRGLSSALANRPEDILQNLCDQTMVLCGAGSAGVSLLVGEAEGDSAFYWPAISGAWAKFVQGGMPLHASPCGRVLAADASLIFLDPATEFPTIIGVEPVIREVLLAPFHLEGRPVGTVWALAHDGEKPFDGEDRRRLESLAGFAATAYQALKHVQVGTVPHNVSVPAPSQAELERLAALRSYDLLDSPAEPEFDALVQLARSICDTPVALVSLVDRDRQWFKAKAGFDGCETPLSQSVCVHAIQEQEILVIPDLTRDPRSRDNTLVTQPPHIRFYAGAVMRNAAGHALGALCVIDTRPRPEGLSDEQARNLILLARQAMALIELRKAVGMRDVVLVDQHRAATGVTERLRVAQDRLRSTQNAARIGTFEVDIPSRRVFVTDEFTRIFGLPAGTEFGAEELMAMIVPEDRGIASSTGRLQDGSATPAVEYRIRRGDGAVRWISRRGAFEHDATGKPVRFLGMVEDITERKAAERRNAALLEIGDRLRDAETKAGAVGEAARLLGEALGVAQTGYVSIDQTAGICNIEGSWAVAGRTPPEGRYPYAVFPRTIERMRLGAPINVPNLSGASWISEDLPTYRAMGAASAVIVPLLERGALSGAVFVHGAEPRGWLPEEVEFVSAVADRLHAAVARLQAMDDQRVLNQELGHRMKNTMAMVQSIAQQTLRGKAETEALRDFDQRLASLGRAHDALLANSWVGARIGAVVDAALALHGSGERVTREGPELPLNARAALGLTLLLHELLTNALKYGALSNGTGRVDLAWSVEGHGDKAEFRLSWTESGGPVVETPTRRGFGSRLLKAGLGGLRPIELDYHAEGVVARLSAPLSRLIEQ